MDVYKGIEAVILANDSHQFVCSLSLTDVSCEWCSTCPSTLPSWLTGVATVKTAWLFLSSAGLQSDVWVYMRDHDPSDEGTGPQSWTIILTTTQSRNLPSNRCLKPFVEPFGTEPKPTYLHSYLHGNPAAQSFSSSPSFLHPSLASALSLCLCLYIFSPRCLKSNPCSHINLDQSNLLILFSRGDTDILMQVQLHRDEKGQALRISEYLKSDANFYHTLYI